MSGRFETCFGGSPICCRGPHERPPRRGDPRPPRQSMIPHVNGQARKNFRIRWTISSGLSL